jgi:hypothetical protein
MMTAEEGRQRIRIRDAGHAPVRGRIARATIVIAPHEHDLETRMAIAPRGEARIERSHASRLRVKEIAEDHQARRGCLLDEARQAREVGGGCAARQRHATGAKGRALPRWTSATNSVCARGQLIARSAKSSTRSFAMTVENAFWALIDRVGRSSASSAAVDDKATLVMTLARGALREVARACRMEQQF